MFYLGDFGVSETMYVPFDTYDSNGASVTITGLATTDIEIYKNGSTTQRSSDNGYALLDTDGIDFDSATGLHGFSIDLSDNSDSGFYAAGSVYWLNVNSITCDSQTVRLTYYFTIGKVLRPATAGRTLVVDSSGLADANTVKVGPSGSGTAQTARDIGGTLGVAGASLTAIPWNSSWDAEVQSEVDDALVAAIHYRADGGRIWYVAKTGNDSNAGTKASPKLTVQAAVTAAASGDVIFVRAGTYTEEVTISSKPYLTIVGEGWTTIISFSEPINGGTVTLDHHCTLMNLKVMATDAINGADAIWCEKHNCRILNVWSDATNEAIHTGAATSNLVVSGCTLHGDHGGGIILGDGNVFENCIITCDCTNTSEPEYFGLQLSNGYTTIVRNTSITVTRTDGGTGDVVGLNLYQNNAGRNVALIENVKINVSSSHASMSGTVTGIRQYDDDGPSFVEVRGGEIITSNAGSGTVRDIDMSAESNSIARVRGTRIDSSKTAGTVQILDKESSDTLDDTDELQTDWVNGGRLDVILDARASQTSVDAVDDFIDTEVSAIKTKTDFLPSATAGASGGLTVAGSNAATTFATLTITGEFSINGTSNVAQTGDSFSLVRGLICANGAVGGTGNDTTHVHLNGVGTYGNDELNSMLLVIYDTSATEYHARWIEDYADTGDLATVATLPFTPVNTDLWWLLPVRADVTGGSGLDAAGVRSALGMSSANMDTQLGAIDTVVDDIQTTVDGVETTLSDLGTDEDIAAAVRTELAPELAFVDAPISGVEGGSGKELLKSTTIATLTDQTHFTLTDGSTDNDAYKKEKGVVFVITDQSDADQKAVVVAESYVGSTKGVVLVSAPVFTIAAGDTVDIMATSYTPAPRNITIQAE